MSTTYAAPALSRRRTFTLLSGLYVSQFLGVGFFFTALVAILRDRGASLEQLSTIQALGLVWAVKVFWAPLLDRYGSRRRGHYRGWLLVLQPLIAVSLLAMIGLDPVGDFGPMMALAALVVLFSATQDIAADALAVRILAPTDRGIGNGIQVGGGYLGTILGGGAVLVVYDTWGWAAAIGTLVVLTLLPTWLVLRYREPLRTDEPTSRPGYRDLLTVFRQPGVVRWSLVLLPVLWLGVGGSYALVTPMLVDAGWSLSRIGLTTTILAGSGALLAALGSGLLVRRFGRKPMMLVLGSVQVLAVLALLPLAGGRPSDLVATVAVCAMNAAYAAMSTVVYTINMDFCRPTNAGSDFTLLTTVSFVASLAAGALALNVAGAVGYSTTLVAAAVLLGGALVAVALTFADRAGPAAGEAGSGDAVAGRSEVEPAVG
ncbi:MFS transporter [uncultured Friedmanniella sp.]|uniref:MFS transporter n=1 Tax=uncultured Friedmanniella sp. TaxID=335381 RepID=UPI0035CBD1ED